MIHFRRFQSPLYEIDIDLRRANAAWRFLLKCVQYVNGLGKANRVYGAVGVAIMVFNHFEDARTQSFPWLCVGMTIAKLRQPKSIANLILHRFWKRAQIL
jgi:hypothetical protein